ncbi:MAG: SDR family NAD(P)-dependent oxidoreductase [Novosphingobium sp.]|nr:SDR family NAD(P)-dependent oxidoreductase [Novosphingobium sp.]
MEAISFAGRVAIVTGAGGGLGREHALELARRGASVIVNDLGGDVGGHGSSGSMADHVVEEICTAGGTAIANNDSVTSTKGAYTMVEQAIREFGRIDVLINNAGIMRNFALEELGDDDWDAVIATHLTGSFRMTRAVWPHMKAQGYGRIVFTASSAGIFGNAYAGAYGPAKAGMVGLMNTAALEGREHGILCNSLMPNAMTRMAARAGEDWADKIPEMEHVLPPEIGNSFNPEFNTPLAVYLASEACTDTQGLYSQCLGRSARVFIGVGHGWQAQRQSAPSVEQIAEHWAEIRDLSAGYAIPTTATEEHGIVLGAASPVH